MSRVVPADHPQRRALADEAHARPAPTVSAPAAVSCIALESGDADVIFRNLCELAVLHAIGGAADRSGRRWKGSAQIDDAIDSWRRLHQACVQQLERAGVHA